MKQPSTKRNRSLALLSLLFPVLAALLTAPGTATYAQRQAATAPAWRDTGVSLSQGSDYLCWDGSRPDAALASVAGTGIFAFDLAASAAAQRLNAQFYNLCGPDGALYDTVAAAGGAAQRYSRAEPLGRKLDHKPTNLASDGSQQLYSLDSAAPEYSGNIVAPRGSGTFWASSDAGRTWQQRGLQLGGKIESLAVAFADAQVIYALTVDRVYTAQPPANPNTLAFHIYFSPDGGSNWQKRYSGQAQGGGGSWIGPFLTIDPIAGYGTPASALQLTINPGYPGSGNYRTIMLSIDGAGSFVQMGQFGLGVYTRLAYSGDSLLLLKNHGQQANGSSAFALTRSTDHGVTWQDLALPPLDLYGAVVPQFEAASAVAGALFISDYTSMWYSPNTGATWEQFAAKSNGAPLLSPYLPLRVLGVQDGRLYRLDLPDARGALRTPVGPNDVPSDTLYSQTGHNLWGVFAQYWNAHDGLAQQGFPLSEQFREVSATDGKIYTVQYFERAVFELHPENAPPYNVLLSLLGSAAYRARYGAAGAARQRASSDNALAFPQTGHALGGKFRRYWEAHGDLAQQGYPVSDEFPERSALDGKTYTVQYFQRAVFELHPENAGTPYEVLLSQLGALRSRSSYPAPALPQCGAAVAAGFGVLWRDNPDLANALGCATAPAAPLQSAVEHFQHGTLLYFAPTASTRYPYPLIIVIYADGSYSWWRDSYVAGQTDGCSPAAPSGLFTPVHGFNKIWCNYAGEKLGWATDQEQGGAGLGQAFDQGMLLQSSVSDRSYAFYAPVVPDEAPFFEQIRIFANVSSY